MRNNFTLILCALVLLVAPLMAQVETEEEYFSWVDDDLEFMPAPPEEEFEGLGLTDKQREQIYELSYNFKKNQIQDKTQLKLAEMELHHMIYKNESRKNIEKQIDKVVNLRMKLLKQRMLHGQDVREVLTPEQRKMLLKMKMHPGMQKGFPEHGMKPHDKDMQKKRFMMKKTMHK